MGTSHQTRNLKLHMASASIDSTLFWVDVYPAGWWPKGMREEHSQDVRDLQKWVNVQKVRWMKELVDHIVESTVIWTVYLSKIRAHVLMFLPCWQSKVKQHVRCSSNVRCRRSEETVVSIVIDLVLQILTSSSFGRTSIKHVICCPWTRVAWTVRFMGRSPSFRLASFARATVHVCCSEAAIPINCILCLGLRYRQQLEASPARMSMIRPDS